MAKTFSFVVHDESLNTRGFRMLTSGVDLASFRENPVMLLNHSDWDLPIGRWENIRIEGSRILADAAFDEADEAAVKIMRKVERGFFKSLQRRRASDRGLLRSFAAAPRTEAPHGNKNGSCARSPFVP
jgi:hypothetical protein